LIDFYVEIEKAKINVQDITKSLQKNEVIKENDIIIFHTIWEEKYMHQTCT